MNTRDHRNLPDFDAHARTLPEGATGRLDVVRTVRVTPTR
jgi:hypothetical protein